MWKVIIKDKIKYTVGDVIRCYSYVQQIQKIGWAESKKMLQNPWQHMSELSLWNKLLEKQIL